MTFQHELMFILAGVTIYLVGAGWVLVLALKKSFWWALLCLFIPIAAFLFIIFHWPSTKDPLFLKLSGTALIISGVLVLKFYN